MTQVYEGWDCASPVTSEIFRQMQGLGTPRVFACRYLVPSGWKRLTWPEVEDCLTANGIFVSVFERTANRALGGYLVGYQDGIDAAACAAEVGQPKGTAIYTAVDFDVTAGSANMATVLEYIRGFSDATPDYLTGVYGNYAVIRAAQDANVCSRYWQTYAWSRGLVADDIHLFQYDNGDTGLGFDMFGITVDWTKCLKPDTCGWWGATESLQVDEPIESVEETPAPAVEPGAFADVSADHWNNDNLQALKTAGIVNGYDDGTFRGDNEITRHEAAAMIGKVYNSIKGEQMVTMGSAFTDVPADHWNAANLTLLKEAGIVSGYEDGTFRGDNAITRHEVAAMVAKLYDVVK